MRDLLDEDIIIKLEPDNKIFYDDIIPESSCNNYSDENSKPTISLGDNMHLDVHVQGGLKALGKWNNPYKIFQIGGSLVGIENDGTGHKITKIRHKYLKYKLAEAAYWTDGEKETNVYPHDSIVGAIIETSSEWVNIPFLKGLTNTPIPRLDGSINITSGYDQVTCYYFTPGLDVPEIPLNPSKEDAIKAARYLDMELFKDFPIKNESSKANLLAALITPVLRPICGITPLFAITKPSPGEGASLIVDIISMVCTGNKAPVRNANLDNNDEWQKVLISILRSGYSIVNFDNLDQNQKFKNPVIASFLTADIFQSRLLGQLTNLTLNNTLCSYLTGRNITLAGDIPRRTVLIELKAIDNELLFDPVKRNFYHPDIIGWIKENRGDLIAAIITMFRAWVIAGKPSANVHLIGSFETWCTMLSGILAYADVKGFLDNRAVIHDQMNTELNEWSAFADALLQNPILKEKGSISARELYSAIMKDTNLQDTIPSEMEDSIKRCSVKALGMVLKSQMDVPLSNGLVIKATMDKVSKIYKYSVEKDTK